MVALFVKLLTVFLLSIFGPVLEYLRRNYVGHLNSGSRSHTDSGNSMRTLAFRETGCAQSHATNLQDAEINEIYNIIEFEIYEHCTKE